MRNILGFILAVVIFLSLPRLVFADSNYVLPYPSSMPGSFLYKIHLAVEKISKYWYFGDFGQFDYNLKESDKYLVEAKTLFDYKQYLLGYKALEISNSYFSNISKTLENAKKNNKNISEKEKLLKQAALKHLEVLGQAEQVVPKLFIWRPEKKSPTSLNFDGLFKMSKSIRENVL